MNKIIKKQLEKVKVVLPPYDDDTTELFIPKQNTLQVNNFNLFNQQVIDYVIGGFYILELKWFITNPTPNSEFDLAGQWNNGIIPQSKYIRCQVMDIKGKMINVGAIGYDLDNN